LNVSIIGFPYVGKTSILESLRGELNPSDIVQVQDENDEEIYIDKNIKIIDTPSYFFDTNLSDTQLVLHNFMRAEEVEDLEPVIEEIINRCTKEKLCEFYKISSFGDIMEFLNEVGKKKCCLLPGNIVDIEKTAEKVLKDWSAGKIKHYSLPPNSNNSSNEKEQINWKEKIDLDIIKDLENNILEKLKDNIYNYFPFESKEIEDIKIDIINEPENIISEEEPINNENKSNNNQNIEEEIIHPAKKKRKLNKNKKEDNIETIPEENNEKMINKIILNKKKTQN